MEMDASFMDKFDKYQLEQIRLGLKSGVDISVYADPQYMAIQMEWIRKGLEDGIDVSPYADPEYDWFQMEEIYKGITASVDVSKYQDPSIPYERMREIREGLEQGVDLSPFGKYGAEELKQLRLALKDNVHIVNYILQGYDAEQLEIIRKALLEGIDIDPYLSKEYRGIALNEIFLGLKKKIAVGVYAHTDISWQQMREIREGIEERLDITKYCSGYYNASQMHEIRMGLELGLDVDSYRSLMYTAKDMRKMRLKLIEELTGGSDIPMIPGEDGYYEYLFDTQKTGGLRFTDNGAVDFLNSYQYANCSVRDIIAIYHEATEGKNGISADGKVIKAVRGKEKHILSGKGVYYDEKYKAYVASTEGWIFLDEDEDVLEIKQAVKLDEINPSMGRIVMSENLEVLGNIAAGSKLVLDGNLIVDGHVESASITCSGTIFIRGGINGNGIAMIDTQKSLICSYIENCAVSAKGDVIADYILSSRVECLGTVTAFGNRGSIIGSEINALKGITCIKAGNEAKIPTRLNIVFSDEDDRKAILLDNERDKASRELHTFLLTREKFKAKHSVEFRNNNKDFIKLENAIYTKNLEIQNIDEEIRKLNENRIKKSDSKITVIEKVYDGVVLSIDWHQYVPPETKGKIVVSLIDGKMNLNRE